MARPRLHRSNAEKQRAYRERQAQKKAEQQRRTDEIERPTYVPPAFTDRVMAEDARQRARDVGDFLGG